MERKSIIWLGALVLCLLLKHLIASPPINLLVFAHAETTAAITDLYSRGDSGPVNVLDPVAVSELSDGQPEVPAASPVLVSEISDGQPQFPASNNPPEPSYPASVPGASPSSVQISHSVGSSKPGKATQPVPQPSTETASHSQAGIPTHLPSSAEISQASPGLSLPQVSKSNTPLGDSSVVATALSLGSSEPASTQVENSGPKGTSGRSSGAQPSAESVSSAEHSNSQQPYVSVTTPRSAATTITTGGSVTSVATSGRTSLTGVIPVSQRSSKATQSNISSGTATLEHASPTALMPVPQGSSGTASSAKISTNGVPAPSGISKVTRSHSAPATATPEHTSVTGLVTIPKGSSRATQMHTSSGTASVLLSSSLKHGPGSTVSNPVATSPQTSPGTIRHPGSETALSQTGSDTIRASVPGSQATLSTGGSTSLSALKPSESGPSSAHARGSSQASNSAAPTAAPESEGLQSTLLGSFGTPICGNRTMTDSTIGTADMSSGKLSCTPPCRLVLPNYPLTTPTVITPSPMTTTLTQVSVSINKGAFTTGHIGTSISVLITTVITPPPTTISTMQFMPQVITACNASLGTLTPRALFAPAPILLSTTISGTLISTTVTIPPYAPETSSCAQYTDCPFAPIPVGICGSSGCPPHAGGGGSSGGGGGCGLLCGSGCPFPFFLSFLCNPLVIGGISFPGLPKCLGPICDPFPSCAGCWIPFPSGIDPNKPNAGGAGDPDQTPTKEPSDTSDRSTSGSSATTTTTTTSSRSCTSGTTVTDLIATCFTAGSTKICENATSIRVTGCDITATTSTTYLACPSLDPNEIQGDTSMPASVSSEIASMLSNLTASQTSTKSCKSGTRVTDVVVSCFTEGTLKFCENTTSITVAGCDLTPTSKTTYLACPSLDSNDPQGDSSMPASISALISSLLVNATSITGTPTSKKSLVSTPKSTTAKPTSTGSTSSTPNPFDPQGLISSLFSEFTISGPPQSICSITASTITDPAKCPNGSGWVTNNSPEFVWSTCTCNEPCKKVQCGITSSLRTPSLPACPLTELTISDPASCPSSFTWFPVFYPGTATCNCLPPCPDVYCGTSFVLGGGAGPTGDPVPKCRLTDKTVHSWTDCPESRHGWTSTNGGAPTCTCSAPCADVVCGWIIASTPYTAPSPTTTGTINTIIH